VSREDPPSNPDAADDRELPFPDSLCHECAAPARYIKTQRSIFIYCPLFNRYPPQPVRACEKFTLKADALPRTSSE